MKTEQTPAVVRQWVSAPLPRDVAQSLENLSLADDVRQVAVMPDVHLAREVCVGVALATSHLLYPAAVGQDIGCGMLAVGFQASAGVLADEKAAARLLTGLYRRVPALKHSAETTPERLPQILDQPLSDARLEKLKRRDGRVQFGTLGRGNHFLEFQRDQEDRLWLVIHSGSRVMGQAVSEHHLARATSASRGLASLDAETDAGREYLADQVWALEYARQNRLAMMNAAVELMRDLFEIDADPATLIHGHHNHVLRETHAGQPFWVHRKGALSAAGGELGVIPGSMGTASYHVEGRGHEPALRSSSHGAGRALSRSEAVRTIGARQFLQQMHGVWFDHRRAVQLRGEAPAAYKDIRAVMRAQRELTKIVRTLCPVLIYKGK